MGSLHITGSMTDAIRQEITRIREILAMPEPKWRSCRHAATMYGLNISLDERNQEFYPSLRQSFIEFYERARNERKSIYPKFELYGPDCGWIDIKVTTDLGDSECYPVSDYQGDDAFYDIIKWMESLTLEDSAFRLVEAEGIIALFGFEKIDENSGMFIFASGADKITGVFGICDKNEIIKGLYEAVMFFSSEPRVNAPKYNVYWNAWNRDSDFDIYDEFGQNLYDEDVEKGTTFWRNHMIFHEVYRSDVIENYLSRLRFRQNI